MVKEYSFNENYVCKMSNANDENYVCKMSNANDEKYVTVLKVNGDTNDAGSNTNGSSNRSNINQERKI